MSIIFGGIPLNMHLLSSVNSLCMLTCENLHSNSPNLQATNCPLWLWLTLGLPPFSPVTFTSDSYNILSCRSYNNLLASDSYKILSCKIMFLVTSESYVCQ